MVNNDYDKKGASWMKLKKKKFILALSMVLILSGCSQLSENPIPESGAEYTEIELNGKEISIDGSNVSINGKVATITAPGTYRITGNLEDGQIMVNCSQSGRVNLVLSDANITNTTGAPIWISEANETVVTLEENTESTLIDAEIYDDIESGVDAAFYSADDLLINGSGSLIIVANYNDGISSKDGLTIDGGNITITAQNHGIKGKDYLEINNGQFTIEAGGDALKATNDADTTLGYVKIEGGTFNLKAMDDGIYGVTDITINGGSVNVVSENIGIKSEGVVELTGGKINIEASDEGIIAVTVVGDDAAEVVVNGEQISLT